MPPPPSAETGHGPFAEADLPGIRPEGGPPVPLHGAFLDARTGRLCCPSLGLETDQHTGRITESRLVRAFGDDPGTDAQDTEEPDPAESGGVLCASENLRVADHGRPGRECADCEERHASCTPRWRIVWEEAGIGPSFSELALSESAYVHTLSATGTVQFTRYHLALRREGLRLRQVLTRIFPERLCRPGAGQVRWCLRFEKIGLFEPVDAAGTLPTDAR